MNAVPSAPTKRCPTCNRSLKRTLPQNDRLHKLFTEIAANCKAADGEYHPAAWWKIMAKDRWLGYNEYRRPDGKLITELKSTADCTVEELTDFMNEVERDAARRGVYLDDVFGAERKTA